MSVLIDIHELQKIFPNTKPETLALYIDPLNDLLPAYDINREIRVAHFIGQTGHESQGYKRTVENLNYSAAGLRTVFKKHFSSVDPKQDLLLQQKAKEYERMPEKIANYVYANRMGNGPEASGDGWKHRGVGLIQTTGKHNQILLAEKLGMSLDNAIAYARTPEGAVRSACIFWQLNNLNRFAEKNDVIGMTKAINGGGLGLAERQALTENAFIVLTTP